MEDKDIASYAETFVVPELLNFLRCIIDPQAAEDISMQFSSVETKRVGAEYCTEYRARNDKW